jgi:hypothetical protein
VPLRQHAVSEPHVTEDPLDADDNATDERPVRRGSVDIRTRDGRVVHHDEAFVRYEPGAFVVSTEASFPAGTTETYQKADVAWVEVRHPRG